MNRQADVSTERIEIQAADGAADAVFCQPAGQGRWPGALLLTDIGGIRPAHETMAQRLAGAGFAVLMPNVFYRTDRPPVIEYPVNWHDEGTRKRFAELTGPLTPDAMARDGAAYVRALGAHRSVSGSHVGVVGYCFTGAMAFRMAAALPAQVAAAASFHGGRLCTDAPTSPHGMLPRVTARLYFGHASNDQSMPAEAIEKLDRALAVWGGRFESETYADAHHGWTVPDSAAFNAAAADRAFAKLRALFEESVVG